MSLISRFFGKRGRDDDPGPGLAANPDIKDPLGLQILLDRKLDLGADAIQKALRAYHPSMARARVEIDAAARREGKLVGLVGWDRHVVRLVGFDLPMPRIAVETCVGPSHYGPELKEKARGHVSHVLLYYAGYETSPLEQYVAVAAVAGALAGFGAIVVLNGEARTSFPAPALSAAEAGRESLGFLRELPLLILYCGFVKYEATGGEGVWMRTHGAHRFGLPDFAARTAGPHEGETYFGLFSKIFLHLQGTGATLAEGHTMHVGEGQFLRFRKTTPAEHVLECGGDLLVAEKIGHDPMT